MKRIIVAFDCDGTLIQNGALDDHQIVANERIRSLLIGLAHSKNVQIIVWSGGGELWARQVGKALGLDRYVWKYMSKNHLGKKDGKHVFDPGIVPDIAFDDIQDCVLGEKNIIVREK